MLAASLWHGDPDGSKDENVLTLVQDQSGKARKWSPCLGCVHVFVMERRLPVVSRFGRIIPVLVSLTVGTVVSAQTELSMWYHGSQNEFEREIIVEIVEDFNASQPDWKVILKSFPEGSYNDSVVQAAQTGNLPDIIDVDAPVVANWAWLGYLQPLNLTEAKVAAFLPSAVGRWNGHIYSVGLWEAALAILTRKSTLEKYDIRLPSLAAPWSADEFETALVKIKKSGDFEYPLDLGLAREGEWFPYAISPFLQSFGGDLIDRSAYDTAQGVLNGEAALKFGRWWQSLFTRGLVPGPGEPQSDRTAALIEGRYAMAWDGNWSVLDFIEAFGEDAVFLPAPDFGQGSVIGAGSWQFGVSATSKHVDGASAFVEFAIQDRYLSTIADELGLIPPTPAAASASANYGPEGRLSGFVDLSRQQALLRPVSPSYVVIAKVFERALVEIAEGGDVKTVLDEATDDINRDIKRNAGYVNQLGVE
ncbi:MAG: multiple sugar transport system substrate-binding protein [Pseudophaeobacter arcticus]|jgi:multiple sugar transport system substrate-binding protein